MIGLRDIILDALVECLGNEEEGISYTLDEQANIVHEAVCDHINRFISR